MYKTERRIVQGQEQKQVSLILPCSHLPVFKLMYVYELPEIRGKASVPSWDCSQWY